MIFFFFGSKKEEPLWWEKDSRELISIVGGPPGTPEKDIDWKISITLLTWLLDPSFPIYFSIKFFFLKFWGKLKKKEKKKRKPSSRREVVMLNISCSIWGGPAVSMQFGDMIMNFKKQRFWIIIKKNEEKKKKKKKKKKRNWQGVSKNNEYWP